MLRPKWFVVARKHSFEKWYGSWSRSVVGGELWVSTAAVCIWACKTYLKKRKHLSITFQRSGHSRAVLQLIGKPWNRETMRNAIAWGQMANGCKCVVTRSEGWWCWVQRHGELWRLRWRKMTNQTGLIGTPSWIQLPPFEDWRVQLGRRGQNALRFWNAISYDEIFKGLVLDPEAMDGHGMSCSSSAAELLLSVSLSLSLSGFFGVPSLFRPYQIGARLQDMTSIRISLDLIWINND